MIRQCKGIALGGAGENREWPKCHDLADLTGGEPRRADPAGSGVLSEAVAGAISVRADSIGFDIWYSDKFDCITTLGVAVVRPVSD